VPTNGSLISVLASAASGDRIYVMAGYTLTLTTNLGIPQSNLWIIGPAPIGAGATIDVYNSTIVITGADDLILGLNIVRSLPYIAPPAVAVNSPAVASYPNSIIENNVIAGPGAAISGSGIEIINSQNNLIANNTIIGWNTSVQIYGGMSNYNRVKLNTLNNYTQGIWLNNVLPLGQNWICWNNLLFPYPLSDDVGNPIDYFDGSTDPYVSPLVHVWLGNYYVFPPPGYKVPPNNMHIAGYPLGPYGSWNPPISPIPGDINLDGGGRQHP
jgi:hypothetical protein